MVDELNKNHIGLTLGSIFGLMHLLWVIVVGLGFGQSLANFWHSMHFLTDMHTFAGFSFGTAVLGVIMAFVSGYVIGFVFAALWNWLGEKF